MPVQPGRRGKTFAGATPSASLAYSFSHRTSAYLSFRTGYRSGVCEPTLVPTPQEIKPIKPERITAYELGIKMSQSNRPLNAAAFYYIFCDLQYSMQWDALAHWGRMFDIDGSGTPQPVYYNGFRAHADIVGPDDGKSPHADRLGIENLAMTGVQGRGVMIDLVRMFGTSRTLIGYAELMRAIDAQKVQVRPGDFVVLYTGYADALLTMARSPDEAILHTKGAVLNGADGKLLQWVADSGAVALISDNVAVEAFEFGKEPDHRGGMLPLHDLCLFRLGIHLGELWWLGDLARYLRQTQRSAFLLTAPPLRLPGAVGSPAMPVATV